MPKKPKKKPASAFVMVRVRLKTTTKGTIVTLSKDPAHVSVKKKQQILWVADEGHTNIRFRRTDTPWAHRNHAFEAPWSTCCTSGPARKESVRDNPYKYTVVVINPDTGESALVDPGVVIED